MASAGLLEREVDEVFLKGKIREAIDLNGGSLDSGIVIQMAKLSPGAMREINSYIKEQYPSSSFPRTHSANIPYLMQLAELRMKAANSRLQPDYH